MHHMLSIFLTVPMILFYPSLRALHVIMQLDTRRIVAIDVKARNRDAANNPGYNGAVKLQVVVVLPGCTASLFFWDPHRFCDTETPVSYIVDHNPILNFHFSSKVLPHSNAFLWSVH
jgi:hypothetical protein